MSPNQQRTRHCSCGLAASTSTRASHRWIRRAIREPTYPAARPGGSAAFSQSAAPPPQAAVFSKQLPMLSGSQRPLTPRAPTPLDAVIRTRLDQRSMDDQRQRDAERGHAQRRCRFEAKGAASTATSAGLETAPSGHRQPRRCPQAPHPREHGCGSRARRGGEPAVRHLPGAPVGQSHRPGFVVRRVRSDHRRGTDPQTRSDVPRGVSAQIRSSPHLATNEAQLAVGWPVIDCDQPGGARLHEWRARMARRRRLIRRPANFESGSATVAPVGPPPCAESSHPSGDRFCVFGALERAWIGDIGMLR